MNRGPQSSFKLRVDSLIRDGEIQNKLQAKVMDYFL